MLYNQERPYRFDGVVGQYEIVNNISNQSIKDKFFSTYILCGQFGAGKTTIARIISLASNCKHKDEKGNPCLTCDSCKVILNGQTTDVLEIDGASNNGVDNIRELKESVSYIPCDLKRKIYIIDEVHMLSKGAFNSLLKILEEPPEYAIFILCTTELKAIPATIRSRAAVYYFGQIHYDDIVKHIKNISCKHGIEIEDDAISVIAKNSSGSLRNALALLDQVSKNGSKVCADDVARILGISDPKHIFELLGFLLDGDTANCIKCIEYIVSMGKDLFLLVSDMLDICADGVVASCSNMDHIQNTQHYKEQLSRLVKKSNKEQFCTIATSLIDIRDELRKAPSKTTLIIGIIRMTNDIEATSTKLLKRISELENIVKNIGQGTRLNSGTMNDCSNDVDSGDNDNKEEDDTMNVTAALENETKGKVENESEADKTLFDASEIIVVATEKHYDLSPSGNEIESNEEQTTIYDNENNEALDLFSMLDLFGKISTPDTPVNNILSESDSEEKKTISKQDNKLIEDIKDEMQNGLAKNDISSDKELQINVENTIIQSELKKVEACLNALFEEDPIIENAIMFGCKRTVTSNGVVFVTSLEPIYKLVNFYVEIKDLPFEVKLVS